MGRGVNAPHRRSDALDDLEGVPHVSMDCGFLGEKESEDRASPVLVIQERTRAVLVPRKGTEFPWIAKRAAKFIDQLGHNRVTLRCDNEPAIEAVAREIEQARQEGGQTVPERPPVGESQSNGIIERAVVLAAGHARTLKAALEHRMGARVPPDARILCWLVGFAAYLMNRCDISSDGKTPLRRHGILFDSLRGARRLLPLGCQFSQYCSCARTIRQLAVDFSVRRRICKHRRGFRYARSATMMGDTLTVVFT